MEILEYIQSLSAATNISISAFQDDKIYRSSICMSDNFLYKNISEIIQENSPIIIDGLFFTYLLHKKDIRLLIGPIKIFDSNEETLKHALSKFNLYMSNKRNKEIVKWYKAQPTISYSVCMNTVNLLSLYLFHEPIQINNPESFDIKKDVVFNENEIMWSQDNLIIVEQMKDLIRNGNVEQLKEYFKTETSYPYGELASDVLRHFKNSMMVHIYIMRCAAREGGLEEDLCIRLSELYSQQCENAKTLIELEEISRVLRLDFCRRVRDIKRRKYNDALVNKAIEYIHLHRYEKLTGYSISEALHVSESYLCNKIKKETGFSIVDHILNEKIEIAKSLLKHSSYSISEIANLLSFSSQAYFNTIFKTKTGMTPNTYKMNK